MKKGIILMSLLAMLLGLTGCKTVKTNFKLKELHYNFGSSWRVGDHTYDIKQIDDKYLFKYEMPCEKYGPSERYLSVEDITKIEEICKQYSVNKWNGFDKANTNILDGDSYGIHFIFEDAEVEASGYMSYPNNYHEFMKALNDILNPYITDMNEELYEKYRNQNFDGDIKYFSINVFDTKSPSEHKYCFQILADDTSVSINYDYKQSENGYSCLLTGEHKGNLDDIGDKNILEQLNQIVKKYNLKQFDSVRNTDDPRDKVHIYINYDDEKHLELGGLAYSDNWETILNEILEVMSTVIEEQ